MTTNLENIEHLTINERYILTYIKYKTCGKYPQFFMNNESIAKQIGCKPSSAKTMVNRLIRLGYLNKGKDDNGRRVLNLTGKYYVPLDGVYMNNKEKSILQQDINNFERMEKQYRDNIAEIKEERDNLKNTLDEIIWALEDNGITKDMLAKMMGERKSSIKS